MKKFLSNLYKNRSCIIKIALLVMLFFGVNLYLSFATDTYATFYNGFRHAGKDMTMRNGRPIIELFYELHYRSGLSNESFYYISSVLALIFLGLSIWIYQRILEKYEIGENTRILLAFAGIANLFIIEYFMFIEKCGFMLSILFVVTGVYWIEKFFSAREREKEREKYFCLAVLSIALAIFTYQCTIALFVILSIPFAMRNAENFKKYIFNGIAIGMAYVIPAFVDLAAFKFIFKSKRFVEDVNYFSTFKSVIWGISTQGIITFDLLPWGVFLVIALVIFGAAVAWAKTCQRSQWRIFNVFIIVLGACVFSTTAQLQGSGYFSARAVYPLASIPAALAIDLFVNKEEAPVDESKKKKVRNIALGALTVLLICQYFSFNKIYVDKYRVNALDQYRYQVVYQAIREYQDETGTEIKKVAFYTDAETAKPQYSDLFHTGDLVVSAFTTSWSDLNAMNYYLHTNYERAAQVEKYTEYFAGRNWDTLSKDQLIFDGDTLHICVY